MEVLMYTSTTWFERYKNGEVSWGISEEGKKDYPYMMMLVKVPSSEVIGIETKTIGDGDDQRVFLSYDIQRRRYGGMETKTLNQWMRELGYYWVPGKEQIVKSQLTQAEATAMLARLQYEGAVRIG